MLSLKLQKNIPVALLMLCSGSMTIQLHAAEKLAINKEGIQVWTSQSAQQPIAQYRAETILNTSLENAVGLILDTEYSKQWMPNIDNIKILERNNHSGNFIAYMVIKMPFPLSNRDLVIKGEIYKDQEGRVIVKNNVTTDSRAPVNSNLVRITQYEGDWIFQKITDQQVKVTSKGYADPGGVVPKGIVNSFVQQQPYQMFQKMKIQLKTPRYTQKDLPKSIQ